MSEIVTPQQRSQILGCKLLENVQSGSWQWNETDARLDFVSDEGDKAGERRRKKPAAELRNKPSQQRSQASTGNNQVKIDGIIQRLNKAAMSNEDVVQLITYNAAKAVALDLVAQERLLDDGFLELLEAPLFDQLIGTILIYFKNVFDNQEDESKPNALTISRERTAGNLATDQVFKLTSAEKHVAVIYCRLVLGGSVEQLHHMGGGQCRVSATLRDRTLFECLYNFVIKIVWVVFARKELMMIEREVGRLLRSTAFNPVNQRRRLLEDDAGESTASLTYKERLFKRFDARPVLTPAEYRRQLEKRPPRKTLMDQQSPAMSCLLPNSTELQQQLRTNLKQPAADERTPPDSDNSPVDLWTKDIQQINLKTIRIGIIGENLENFNAISLIPIGGNKAEAEAGVSMVTDGAAVSEHVGRSSALSRATTCAEDEDRAQSRS